MSPSTENGAREARGFRPYGDHRDDGIVQLSFTLPVQGEHTARFAALEIARRMGLSRSEVVHHHEVTNGYTYLVLYGRFEQRVEYDAVRREGFEEHLGKDAVDAFIAREIGRALVVVGASTGSDTHSVGIDAMLNLKGYDGHHGLEGYAGFETHNLGSQVPNTVLVGRALELGADAIVVSQTVTQQDLHIHNLTELVEMVEAEGIRERTTLACGGPRISDELAKELGYDAGFSRGTFPNHLATFLARAAAQQRGAARTGGAEQEAAA